MDILNEKNNGTVGEVANQCAVFQISTNQEAVFGSRDRLDRVGISGPGTEFEWVEPARSGVEMTSAEMTTEPGSEVKTHFIDSRRPSWISYKVYRSMSNSTLRMSTSSSLAAWA